MGTTKKPQPDPQPVQPYVAKRKPGKRKNPPTKQKTLTPEEKKKRNAEASKKRMRKMRKRKKKVDALMTGKKDSKHPGSEAAVVKAWARPKPGEVRNPQGANGLHLTTQLRWILLQPDPDDPKTTIGRQILATAAQAAKSGNFSFFKEIFDRIDGKVPERLVFDMTERLVKDNAAHLCQQILEVIEDTAPQFMPRDKVAAFVLAVGERVLKSLAKYGKNGNGKHNVSLTLSGFPGHQQGEGVNNGN